jgi:hypothetical protein
MHVELFLQFAATLFATAIATIFATTRFAFATATIFATSFATS